MGTILFNAFSPMLQHQTVTKPPETPWLLHSGGITFAFEIKGKLSALHKVRFTLDCNLLFSSLWIASSTSPRMSTTPPAWGLITPALCCLLRNTRVLGPVPRPETGKSEWPPVPAPQLQGLQQTRGRQVLCSGHVPWSDLLPMMSWDAHKILVLILKLKAFFLKHVMLERLNHDSTCKSNSKYYMFLWTTGFPTVKSTLSEREKPCSVIAALPTYWSLCLSDGSALEWSTAHLHCLSHTWISWCISPGHLLVRHLVPSLDRSPGHNWVCWGAQDHTDQPICACGKSVRGWAQTCNHLLQQQSPHHQQHRITSCRPSRMCQIINETLHKYLWPSTNFLLHHTYGKISKSA